MNSKVVHLARTYGLTGLLAGCCLLNPVSQALADGPTLKRLFPGGASRGQTIEVTALGDAPNWPVQVWCDDPAITWQPQVDKGKFQVVVAPTAMLGIHHVRFADKDNASNALRFMIGPIMELNEVEPNDTTAKLQPIPALPKLINGVLSKRGEVDTFAVELDQLQTLIAAVEANENLKSPVDMTLQVLSASGTVLAQNMDSHGLDPMVEFLAPNKGTYFVRVFGQPATPDSTIGLAGADNFVYRLTLTTGGWVKSTRPWGIDAKTETSLKLIGIGVPAEPIRIRVQPKYPRPMAPLDIPGLAHAPLIDLLDLQQSVEETRPSTGILPELKIPVAMTGSLAQGNERDFYSFSAIKDKKLRFSLTSRRLGTPLDGVLRVLELSGTELARVDDSKEESDSSLIFQPPTDGNFVLEVSDAFGNGGPDWVYRVDASPVTPDVALSVKEDHFQGKVNEQLDIPVDIDRRDGYDQTLEVIGVLPTGQQISLTFLSTSTEGAKEGKVSLKSNQPYSGPIRIIAKQRTGSEWVRTASAGDDPLLRDLWLTIK